MSISQSNHQSIQTPPQSEVQIVITTKQYAPVKIKEGGALSTIEGPLNILDHQTNHLVAKAYLDCIQALGWTSSSETRQENRLTLTSSGANPQLEVLLPLVDQSTRPMLKCVASVLVSKLKGQELGSHNEGNSLSIEDVLAIDLSVLKTLKLIGGKRLAHPVSIKIDDYEVELSGKLASRPDLTQFEPQQDVIVGKFDGLSRRGEAFSVITKSLKTIGIQFGKRPVSAAEIGMFMDEGDYFEFVVMVTRKKNGAEIYTLNSFTKLTESIQTT